MSDERIVLPGPGARVSAFLAVGWILMALLPGGARRAWALPAGLAMAAFHGSFAIAATVLTPECLTVRTWRGRRHIAWEDVRDITYARGRIPVAVLRDGNEARVPGVTIRAGVPDAYADRSSAQMVLAYARRHGAPAA